MLLMSDRESVFKSIENLFNTKGIFSAAHVREVVDPSSSGGFVSLLLPEELQKQRRSTLLSLKKNFLGNYWETAILEALAYAAFYKVYPGAILEEIRKICSGKALTYGGHRNHLGNFYRASAEFGDLSPQRVCQLWTYKHIDFFMEVENGAPLRGEEGVLSRVADIVLYSALGQCMDDNCGVFPKGNS